MKHGFFFVTSIFLSFSYILIDNYIWQNYTIKLFRYFFPFLIF